METDAPMSTSQLSWFHSVWHPQWVVWLLCCQMRYITYTLPRWKIQLLFGDLFGLRLWVPLFLATHGCKVPFFPAIVALVILVPTSQGFVPSATAIASCVPTTRLECSLLWGPSSSFNPADSRLVRGLVHMGNCSLLLVAQGYCCSTVPILDM